VIDSESESASDYPAQCVVKMLNRQFLVKSACVDWVQSASNYVILHCADRRYPMRQTMTAVSEQLDPQQFVRVHRTAFVNVHSVALKEGAEAHIELTTGVQVPVSKTCLQDLKHALRFCP